MIPLSTHVIQGNTINGKPLYYYVNTQEKWIVPEDAGEVILVNCSNITIRYLDIQNIDIGINLLYSSNNIISENRIGSSQYEEGIRLFKSSYNSIVNNTVSGHTHGIHIVTSDNNLISANTVQNCQFGIRLDSSQENNVSKNTLSGCGFSSITLDYSDNTVISNNDVSSSYLNCLWLVHSNNNSIYENFFHDSLYFGIELSDAHTNNIFNNHISGNQVGIKFDALFNSQSNNIWENEIKENIIGISISYGLSTRVTQNNFILNVQHATFYSSFPSSSELSNQWYGNYWGHPQLGPHIIYGLQPIYYDDYSGVTVSIPWVNFDWRPALKPYDIPG